MITPIWFLSLPTREMKKQKQKQKKELSEEK